MNATEILMELQREAARRIRTPLVEKARKEIGGEPVSLPIVYRIRGSKYRGSRGHCPVYGQQY